MSLYLTMQLSNLIFPKYTLKPKLSWIVIIVTMKPGLFPVTSKEGGTKQHEIDRLVRARKYRVFMK